VPRYPRQYSKTGIYHIMLRGNERKNILIDKEDKKRFVEIVYQKKTRERRVAILAGVNRETVRKVSKEPSL